MSDSTVVSNSLGTLVWWDLLGTRISPDDLRSLLQNHGYGAYAVPEIKPKTAIRRACSAWGQGRLTQAASEKYKAEIVKVEKFGTSTTISVGILKRHKIGEKRVAWDQVELVAYVYDESKPYDGTWSPGPTGDVARSFCHEADLFRLHHDASWIRAKFLQVELGRMAHLTIRRQGGVYFVPHHYADDVARLKGCVKEIGDCKISVVHVTDDADTRETIAVEASDAVAQHLADIKGQLAEWRESASKVRTDSASNMLQSLSDLLARATLYKDALGIEVKDVVEQMTECRREALRLIGESGDQLVLPAA